MTLENFYLPKSVVRFVRQNIIVLTMLMFSLSMTFATVALIQENNAVNDVCVIQARGLRASGHLTRFMIDWDRLIALQRREDQKILLKEPKAQQEVTNQAIAQLDAYAAIEDRQPTGRSCP